MIGIVLFFFAVIIFLPLQLINFIVVLWVFRKKRSFLKNINEYFYQLAYDIDRYGNRNLRTLWNNTLIKKEGFKFGDERETISSVLGKNEYIGKLTFLGKKLVWILDKIDNNHANKSIKWF